MKPARRLAIVGSEEIKFTAATKERACNWIWALLASYDEVVSGACHLGGIDVWAAQIGREMGLSVIEYPPKTQNWSDGYKPRNMQIARRCTEAVCITVAKLPDTYTSPFRFDTCYHCCESHVKSGGCWTVKQARMMGKPGTIIVV